MPELYRVTSILGAGTYPVHTIPRLFVTLRDLRVIHSLLAVRRSDFKKGFSRIRPVPQMKGSPHA